MSCRVSLGEVAKRVLDTSIHAAREVAAARSSGALAAYDHLVREVRARSELLARRGASHTWAVNRALLAMSLHHDDWLAPIESWDAGGASPREQVASLSAHLFARYPMPQFMSSVWEDGEPGVLTAAQGWYKRVGRGESIRSVDVPMRITRGMAHKLATAPCHFSMVGALRWAQVTELGGSEELVRSVTGTRLGRVLENEDFWETTIHFFVNHPELSLDQVGPVVDFLQNQRFEWRGEEPPPQPELSMKGRSSAALCRLVRDWHRELARASSAGVSWSRAPFRELRWLEKRPVRREANDDRLWTISELCTSRELFVEGRLMRHCVGSYVRSCVSRRASIWSMQAETRRGRERVLTIDVDLPSRRVVQARGKCNAAPGPLERTIVKRWAEREGISVPPALRDLE